MRSDILQLSTKWLNENELRSYKKYFYLAHPHLKKAEYINDPDEGIINLFFLKVDTPDHGIYYNIRGEAILTDREIWDTHKRLNL